MKSKLIFVLRMGAVLAATGGMAHAQFPAGPDGSGEAQELRRYTVEVIVFEYAENVGLGSEIFLPDLVEREIDVSEAMPDDPVEAEPAGAEDEPVDVDLGIQTLQRDEMTMTETLARLERLDAYRPLMHFGWTQATIAEELSPALPLARFGTPPQGLDGDLKLYLNRFLHLVVDVSKLAPGSDAGTAVRTHRPTIDAPVNNYGSASERNAFDRGMLVEEYQPLNYRIREDRIMKNGETRYFDHPKIGVIAKVTRVEEDEPGASAGI